MPRSQGRNFQVNKCTPSNPTTSFLEEANGVKRKITVPKSPGTAKKSKQVLQNGNPAIDVHVNSVMRDEVTNTSGTTITDKLSQQTDVTRDKVANRSTTTMITDKLSQQKDEPLKFQELQNIKKVIRNWKPPPLRKRDHADLTKKDIAKPKEALKMCQQGNTMLTGSETVMRTLVSSDLLTLKDAVNSDTVDADMLSGDVTLITRSNAKSERHEDTDDRIAQVAHEAMSLQLSPRDSELVDSEMDELMIGDSQLDAKTCTNSPFKNEISREHAVIIDLTESQVNVSNSQNDDLLEEDEEIYKKIQDDEVWNDLTESEIQENNSQDIDLFEGEEDIYTEQYRSLKLKIHSAITRDLEENDHLQATPPESCSLTDDLIVTAVKEDMCTPNNDANLLDTTPPTVKRIPHKELNSWKNEIDAGNNVGNNESKRGEEKSDMCALTGNPCVIQCKSKTLPTFESPKLFPDTDSDEDFEEPTRKLQDDKLPLTDICGEKSQVMDVDHHLDFKNGNQDFYNESNDVLPQSQEISYFTITCQKPQNQSDNVRSQNKGINYIHLTNNDRKKCQNEEHNALDSSQNTKGTYNFYETENKVVLNSDGLENTSKSTNNKENVSPTTTRTQTCLNKPGYLLPTNKSVVPVSVSLTPQNNASQKYLSGLNSTVTHGAHSTSQTSQKNVGTNSTIGLNNDVKPHSMQLTTSQHNASQKSVHESQSTTIANKENKDIPSVDRTSQTPKNRPENSMIALNVDAKPHSMSLTPQHHASQKSRNGSNSTTTPNKENEAFPSAHCTSQTSQNGPDNSKIALNDDAKPHSISLTPQHNANQKFVGLHELSKDTTTPIKENKDFPSADHTGHTSQNGPDKSMITLNDYGKPHAMPPTPQHNSNQKSNGSNSTITSNKDFPSAHHTSPTSKNTSGPTTSIEGHTSPTKKADQTPKSQSNNVHLESNDVTENRKPYLYEMEHDFELISSSQLLAIENELKQEMLQESAFKKENSSRPNEGQIAPINVPTTCEGARMPVFSIATMPPLRHPFDWKQKVQDDRQKLRGIVQEMTNLNAMITKVRREMWPRRRPEDGSSRSGVTFPPPQAGPNVYGAAAQLPGNWGQGHSSRY